MARISWDEHFLEIVDAVSRRSSCDRGKPGAVIVKDKRIIATGYAGAPSGLPTCDEVGHELVRRTEINENLLPSMTNLLPSMTTHEITLVPSTHCIRTVHAENNAILNCARNGVSTLGSIMYCTMVPCRVCAMSIIQAGIKKVIAKYSYQKSEETIDMFNKVGIELTILNKELNYSIDKLAGSMIDELKEE